MPFPRRAASAVTRTALFLSPHLDDVVFSCGGLAAMLHDRGWRTILATAFTATVLPARGFALACQLDKGLAAEVDYMALRRDEDFSAAAVLGFSEVRHLSLPEAPHRGYGDAAALFGALLADDPVPPLLAAHLVSLQHDYAADLVLLPQGLGGHVDHRQMVRAADAVLRGPIAWYRDTPYAIRQAGLPSGAAGLERRVRIGAALDRKLASACAYASQIGFQFGGKEGTMATLRDFARAESNETGYAERVTFSDAAQIVFANDPDCDLFERADGL